MYIYYPNENKHQSLKPAIVCIHGGAWSGKKDNTEWNGDYMNVLARYFALKGAVGIIFSYRNIDKPGQDDKVNVNGIEILDLYEDCLAAIRFIRHNANRFGIDVNKIVLLGDSAGGHLASSLGTLDVLRTDEDIKPSYVISCNPITDLNDPVWFKYIGVNTHYEEFKNLNMEERAKLVSPLHNITKDTSPTLLIHGTNDNVVFPRHSIDFYNVMQKLGKDCKLELIEGATHAFILPEYYKDKLTVDKAIGTVDKYLLEKDIYG
jgi:acetyl esterase/lipase